MKILKKPNWLCLQQPTRFYRLGKKVKRSASGLAASMLLLSTVLGVVVLMTPVAEADTATLVPNSDLITQWANTGGTSDSSCSGGTHCDFVDEGSTPNTADYIGTGTAGDTSEIEDYGMTTASNIDQATQISLTVHAQSATNANGGTLDNLLIGFTINGSIVTSSTCTPAFNTWANCTAVTATGDWSQSDIDSLEAVITRSKQGSGSPSGQDDDVRIADVYATLTYTQPPSFTQASHRWFDQDTRTSAASTWTSRTSAADNSWQSVAYGNGLFVATSVSGSGNRVMTSPDGITWTSRTSAANNNWGGVTYGKGLFVAVSTDGSGNRVMTSPDGITWTSRTSAGDHVWQDVTYGNGLFVAVACGISASTNCNTTSGNRVMTSPDGINWTARSDAADIDWQGVSYGNGLFVAVAQSGSGNRVMTSPDGTTWTSRTSAADNFWQSVTYGNGLFVAVAETGSGNRVMTSPDGTNWTSRTSAADNEWQGVTYGNGLFVAASKTGSGNRVMTSPDGITWTSRTSAADNNWRSVAYGNGLFVSVGETGTGNRVMMSPAIDASVGTSLGSQDTVTTATTSDLLRLRMNIGVSSGSEIGGTRHQFALQYATRSGASCSNSETYYDIGTGAWTSRTPAGSNSWNSVAYGNGLFVAVASTGTGNRVMTSPDGVTWTSRTSAADNTWESVTFGNGTFVAVSSDGTNRVMTSTDGIAWTSRSAAAANSWDAVTYGNGLFVAVAYSGTGNRVMTSPDGTTWTSRTSAADNSWLSVTYGNGMYVAVSSTGTGNRVMSSPDGTTWTSRTSVANNVWESVTYGNGLFVAVSAGGGSGSDRVMTSTDGIGWTARTAPDTTFRSVTYNNGLFVAVADSGTDQLATSYDGITWTARTAAANNQWSGVTYGNGTFVAVASNSVGDVETMAPPVNWSGDPGRTNGRVVSSGSDPTQGGSTIKAQNYNSNNYFYPGESSIANGEYGQWDFDLSISKASYDSTYCFRAVRSDGSLLTTYNTWPELTRCTEPPTSKRMRHGKAFCGSTQRFFWKG